MGINIAYFFNTSDWAVGIYAFFPVKMKSFRALQVAHQVAIVQTLTSSGILVEGFDETIIFLHYSTRPLSGTLWEIS